MGDGNSVFVACFGDRSWLNWALNWIHKWGDGDGDSHSGSGHKGWRDQCGGNDERERWIGIQDLVGIQTRGEDHRVVVWVHCCRVGCMFGVHNTLPHPWSVCGCLDPRLASEASSLGLSSRNSWSHCLFCQAAVQQFEPICNANTQVTTGDVWCFYK